MGNKCLGKKKQPNIPMEQAPHSLNKSGTLSLFLLPTAPIHSSLLRICQIGQLFQPSISFFKSIDWLVGQIIETGLLRVGSKGYNILLTNIE